MVKVTQMINSNGNPAANQFIINEPDGQVFQSYNSRIAKIKDGKIMLSPDWDCSATTLKHLKLFLGVSLTKDQIKQRIESGHIILVNEV